MDRITELRPELIQALLETFAMIGVAIPVAVLLGTPLGIWLFTHAPGLHCPATTATRTGQRVGEYAAIIPVLDSAHRHHSIHPLCGGNDRGYRSRDCPAHHQRDPILRAPGGTEHFPAGHRCG